MTARSVPEGSKVKEQGSGVAFLLPFGSKDVGRTTRVSYCEIVSRFSWKERKRTHLAKHDIRSEILIPLESHPGVVHPHCATTIRSDEQVGRSGMIYDVVEFSSIVNDSCRDWRPRIEPPYRPVLPKANY